MKSISNVERQLIGVWNNGRTHTDSFRFWFRAPFDQAYLATNAIFSTNKHKHLFVLYYKYIRKRNGLDCEERKKPVESTTLYPITICINASFNIEWLLSTHIQRAATMPREIVNIVSLVWFFNFQYGFAGMTVLIIVVVNKHPCWFISYCGFSLYGFGHVDDNSPTMFDVVDISRRGRKIALHTFFAWPK